MEKSISCVAAALCCLAISVAGAQADSSPQAADATPAANEVQVLSAGQMARGDADLLASLQNELISAAELNGYDLVSGTWIRNQVVCPDAPRHMIMHYLKLSQDGAVSLFTAVVRRAPPGPMHSQVRIIPVLYHGAPATHVFGTSPSQRELINQVISMKEIASASASAGPGWKSLALCYAALAGAEPSSPSVTAPEAITPIVSESPDGKAQRMSFSVVGPDHLLQDWKIEFDRQLQVKSIVLTTKPMTAPQPLPVTTMKPRPVPSSK
jgi:hypothetical protein